MSFKKFSGILLVAAVLTAIVLVIFDGYWPAVFVNSNAISYKRFKEAYTASIYYYRAGLKATSQDTAVLESDEVQKELKRAVLDSLVEQKLIESELGKRMLSGDLSRMIDEKMNRENLNSENFKKGSELLYGLPVKEFKKIVLIPQVKREILEGRFILVDSINNGQAGGFDTWLKNERIKAKVSVLLSGFYWGDGEMKMK
ncbi:hypothetical protein HZB05_00915 [Candidatus Wolfebacteria bacterium]|nr:hypothetical protein [Candidatus Wolfebacteria bacterium]